MNLERLAVSRVSKRRTVRLIANANHKPPVLEKLASSYGARARLEALESVTNARQIVQQKGIPGLAPEALASGYGFTYINAALAYTRPGGSRFNPPAWGVWYCAFDCETSLQEAAFHLTRALQAAGGDFDNETRYIELLADFEADFVDLRNQNPIPDCLHPDTSIGYPAGQELADEIRKSGHNGLIYPSVRHANGVCLAAFWPGLIQNFQQGESWILKWAGSPTPTIMRAANAS